MYTQDIDEDLNYNPVSRISTLRNIMPIAVDLKLKTHKMDVYTEVLNVELDYVIIYVKPPPGYEDLVPSRKSL